MDAGSPSTTPFDAGLVQAQVLASLAVVLLVFALVMSAGWAWRLLTWRRPDRPEVLPPPAPVAAPERRQYRSAASARRSPPLTEDDVIRFGLELESTRDVIASLRGEQLPTRPAVRPEVDLGRE